MNSNRLLKVCAVSSSLLLVTAFVSYRAGALGWLKTSSDPQSDVINTVDPAPVIHLDPVDTTRGEHMLYSSKSGAVFVEHPTSPNSIPVVEQASDESSVLFSGSKSLQMIPTTPTTESP